MSDLFGELDGLGEAFNFADEKGQQHKDRVLIAKLAFGAAAALGFIYSAGFLHGANHRAAPTPQTSA